MTSNSICLAWPLLTAALIAGCHDRAPRNDAASGKMPPAEVEATESAPAPLPPPAQRERLLAAAERFENLSEGAFENAAPNEPRRQLAIAAAADVRPLLTPDDQGLLDAALVQMATGAREHRPSELAKGASEGFRTVLSAAGGEGTIPLEIGLLDYAGFRIAADNHSLPPRWEDMTKAVLFANQQWSAVKSRIVDEHAVDAFDHVLAALLEGAAARDGTLVGKAAAQELELVDALEKSVRPVPRPPIPLPTVPN